LNGHRIRLRTQNPAVFGNHARRARSYAAPARPVTGRSPVEGKPIIARFDGGSLSSDGGLLALREVEDRLGVAQRLAACIEDPRAPERIQHSLAEMLRFRC
jgi:hypothetical protein